MENPIIEKPYKTRQFVICSYCRGKKHVLGSAAIEICPRCKGEGMLLRINEGTLKLYTIPDAESSI